MKKLLAAVAILVAFSVKAKADGEPMFQVGYSTFAVLSVSITSGTKVQINGTKPTGFAATPGFYRLTNSHPSWDIYVGDVNVSTDVFSANLGQVIKANGGTADFPVGKDPRSAAGIVPIYAKAADSSAVDRLPRLSVIWFGF